MSNLMISVKSILLHICRLYLILFIFVVEEERYLRYIKYFCIYRNSVTLWRIFGWKQSHAVMLLLIWVLFFFFFSFSLVSYSATDVMSRIFQGIIISLDFKEVLQRICLSWEIFSVFPFIHTCQDWNLYY